MFKRLTDLQHKGLAFVRVARVLQGERKKKNQGQSVKMNKILFCSS